MFTLMWQIEIGMKLIPRSGLMCVVYLSILLGSVFLGNMFLNQLREDTIQLELLEPKYGRDGRDC